MKPSPRRGALVGPDPGERKKRPRPIFLAALGVAVALGAAALLLGDGALLDRSRRVLGGVLDDVSEKVNEAANAGPSGPSIRQRPRVAGGVAAGMTRQVVDSIEELRLPLRERYGVDRPLSSDWLTPEYLVAPSRFASMPDQFQARLAFVEELERTAPARVDVELALERIFEERQLVSEGALVQAVERYVSWSVGDVESRSRMADEARDALELHRLLVQHEGKVRWDPEALRLAHPDSPAADELNGLLDRLWPDRPARRRAPTG